MCIRLRPTNPLREEMCIRLRPTNPLKKKRCVLAKAYKSLEEEEMCTRLRPTNPLKIELAAKLTNSVTKEPCGFAKRFFEKLRTLCLATRFSDRLTKNLLFSQKILRKTK